jgi:hypothetical protein
MFTNCELYHFIMLIINIITCLSVHLDILNRHMSVASLLSDITMSNCLDSFGEKIADLEMINY